MLVEFDLTRSNWVLITPIMETEMRNLVATYLERLNIKGAEGLKNTDARYMLPYIYHSCETRHLNTCYSVKAMPSYYKRVDLKDLLTMISKRI